MASKKDVRRRVKRANKLSAFERLFGEEKGRKARSLDVKARKGKQLLKEGARRQKEFLGEGESGFSSQLFEGGDEVGEELSDLF